MAKTKMLVVRITEEQDQVLQAKARAAGFMQISDYVRYTLFMSMPLKEKIDQIHEKVISDGRL